MLGGTDKKSLSLAVLCLTAVFGEDKACMVCRRSSLR